MKRILMVAIWAVCWSISARSFAACTVSPATFEERLNIIDTDIDGFATTIGVPADKLLVLSIDCSADTLATLRISKPFRVKDGGPELKGPLISYFVYKEERYTQSQTIDLIGPLEDQPILIGMSVQNGDNILPASEAYKYQVDMTITVRE